MGYVNFGRTGLKVSRLCLGCMSYGNPQTWIHNWVLNDAESRPYYKKALESGIKPHHLDDVIATLSIKLPNYEIQWLEELYLPHAVAGYS